MALSERSRDLRGSMGESAQKATRTRRQQASVRAHGLQTTGTRGPPLAGCKVERHGGERRNAIEAQVQLPARQLPQCHAHTHTVRFCKGCGTNRKIADLVVSGNLAPASETNWLCARCSFLRARASRRSASQASRQSLLMYEQKYKRGSLTSSRSQTLCRRERRACCFPDSGWSKRCTQDTCTARRMYSISN
jgi:hypothetical protein